MAYGDFKSPIDFLSEELDKMRVTKAQFTGAMNSAKRDKKDDSIKYFADKIAAIEKREQEYIDAIDAINAW